MRQGQGMKRLLIWYLPQAAMFAFGVHAAFTRPGMTTLGAFVTGAMLAAAYTGGANLVISLVSRLRGYNRQPRRQSDSLGTGRGFLGERAQDRQRIGVDK